MQSPGNPEPPSGLPNITTPGAVAAPILLPLSPGVPTLLNMSFATDSTDPRASTALAIVPTVMEFEKDAPRPECYPIHPWDLARPVPLSSRIPCFYDISTQQYWLFTIEGALLLHKTPRATISKKTAHQAIQKMDQAHDVLVNILNMPASSYSAILPDSVILHHAIYDSITVMRSHMNSSFIKFWEDKRVLLSSSMYSSPNRSYLVQLRPTFDGLASHKCLSLYHCGNNIIYCPGCTAYRLPAAISNGSLETGPPVLIGRLTLHPGLAQALYGQCLEHDTKQINVNRAYDLLSQCFRRTTITSIDIPRAWMVTHLLRDSLFVSTGYPTQAQNFVTFFKTGVISGSEDAAAGVAVAEVGATFGLNAVSALLNNA
ncbi:hypothetical protein BJX61DRAFT_502513 [Aspergillus egyptiacus]|nr:hypothetical protein BJX61DRAFT_502513 [Aspergillus egyptiacus]